jgi:hypothetical protein|tara:strand:+ start:2652 stop:2837 length:186 start_codon:yes stop_codon:yes gene_type:complete
MILLFISLAFDIHGEPKCVIDQCGEKTCVVETPEGWVEVPRKVDYYEGKHIACPTGLIEPT